MGRDDTTTAERETTLLVDVLGEVRVHGPAGSRAVQGRQPRSVVAALALEARPVTRDELAELLWGDELGEHWPGALRGVVAKVRATLVGAGHDASCLRIEDGLVLLDPVLEVGTDLGRARLDLQRAEEAQRRGDHGAAARWCTSASTSLCRPFLVHDDSDWGRRWRRTIEDLEARAAHLHIEALRAGGDATAAIARARARVDDDPLDETAHHQLVEALVASGQGGKAIDAYDHLARILQDELGIRPAAATTELLADLTAVPPGTAARPGSSSATLSAPAATATVGARGQGASAGPIQPARRSFHPHDGEAFVGRADQLGVLHRAWDETVAHGSPQLVVLEGPAGIGKTRLASRFAERLARDGYRVLWGRGREGIELAYGAWAEALDHALEDDPSVLRSLGPRAAGLATLLPHLAGPHVTGYRLPDDGAVARTHLFGAMTATVAELARRPTLLVLDDLQWTTRDSLALLEAVLERLRAPLLVVATTRPATPDVEQSLLAFHRLVPLSTVRLDGLSVDELTDLVPDPGLAAALHRRTGGLPFFVVEIARDARRSGRAMDGALLPGAVRSWVHRRVGALPVELAEVLGVVAVAGTPTDLDLLVHVTGHAPLEVAARADELVRLGLLSEVEDVGLDVPHVITGEVVAASLGATRRARIHRLLAEALEEDPATSHQVLAHHWARAGRPGRAAAARHSRLAGREALDRGAWDLAATAFGTAVELADDPAGDPLERVRSRIGAGQAHHALGAFDRAQALLEDALAIAERHGFAPEQAEATLAMVGRAGRGAAVGQDDGAQIRLLRAAVAALEHEPTDGASDVDRQDRHRREALACALDRELAIALLLTDAVEERTSLADRALARARALDPPSPAATAAALLSRPVVLHGPEGLDERLEELDEVLALPADDLRHDVVTAAHCYRNELLVRAGRPTEASQALAQARALADRHHDPYWRWAVRTWEGLHASIAGDLEAAEQLAREAHAGRAGIPGADACLGVNLVNVRLAQGRAAEVVDLLAAAADDAPHIPCYRSVLALCALRGGDAELAEASYRSFADHGFAGLPRDTNRFLALAVLADVAVELGDVEGGRILTELLMPHRGQWVLLNCYGGGGAHWGPAAHHLARLAALDGRTADAVRLFDEAARSSGHAPLVAARIAEDVAVQATLTANRR